MHASSSPSLEAATHGERTKYKALVSHMKETVFGALKKEPEFDEAKLNSLAAIVPDDLFSRAANEEEVRIEAAGFEAGRDPVGEGDEAVQDQAQAGVADEREKVGRVCFHGGAT